MKTLILGANGATGKLLVEQLIAAGREVKIIIRPTSKLHESWLQDEQISIVQANISEMKVDVMAEIISDCDTIVSCLGHNLTLRGVFGKPRKLVTKAVQLICEAVEKNHPDQPVKFVLMNTAGNRNRDLNEPVSTPERIVICLLRLLIPPQADNEKSSDYLRLQIGQANSQIIWVVVRPDSLIDQDTISNYTIHISPTSSAIFKPGKTSRINVAHFMAQLIINKQLWNEWNGQMPVIYNNLQIN